MKLHANAALVERRADAPGCRRAGGRRGGEVSGRGSAVRRAGSAAARAAGAPEPLRAPPRRRAAARRCQEARPDPGRRTPRHRQTQPAAHYLHARRQTDRGCRLGVRPRLRRRRHPTRLRRGAHRRESDNSRGVSAPRRRLLSPPRHQRRARDVRQRLLLPLDHPRNLLPRTWAAPPAHPPLPATHQRQGRRFIRTLLAGWAYGAIYGSSAQRTAALEGWIGPTITADHTAPSVTSRPSLASTSGTTSWVNSPRADRARTGRAPPSGRATPRCEWGTPGWRGPAARAEPVPRRRSSPPAGTRPPRGP